MKEYKLSKDSNETFLVDSDPCKVIESYLESLPSKGKPWIETQNRSGKLTRIYHGVCPYCNNPTFLVGYEQETIILVCHTCDITKSPFPFWQNITKQRIGHVF